MLINVEGLNENLNKLNKFFLRWVYVYLFVFVVFLIVWIIKSWWNFVKNGFVFLLLVLREKLLFLCN